LPILLVSDGYALWRGKSPRLSWVIAGRADRILVRLFVRCRRGWPVAEEADVAVFEASEIASISIRTLDVFLYGPKPRRLEWLVIEPAQAVAEDVCKYIRPLLPSVRPNLCGITPIDPGKQVFVGNEDGRLTIDGKYCRPVLRVFLDQVSRECSSIVIGPENHSELDLNGIWHGFRSELNAEQRRLPAQAIRLGFGRKCAKLLSLYRFMPLREAADYLALIYDQQFGTAGSDCPLWLR